ncbi:hypothetical protein ACKI1I_16240 [Streptomyces turgidiscabies]|uniref:hypothetical protein n=1 Tax=Streptomyces TaxID=1883 RepID=UPI00030417B6|nr:MULTISPECIES: hypothetical protein [Streptomyces]MDX3495123.1 hypothetical protein [Streptomyces turgidiscabies]GAQ70996.1 hypothetical protein T45_02738 [Streptomyces turgidiscabies]
MKSLLAAMKSFLTNLLLWSSFAGGLAASTASGTVLDGTAKSVATYAGIAVSLLAGSRIARRPQIKAFLSKPSTLWFLFLFNGGVAAFCYFTMDGVKGIATAAGMGLVSLGAAGGLVSGRKKPTAPAPVEQQPWA